MRLWTKATCFVLTFAFLISVPASTAQEDNREIYEKLYENLNEFAKKNGLSDEQMPRVLGNYVLNSLAFRKGGIGIIGPDTYIDLDSAKNTLLLNNRTWKGADSRKTQVVLIADARIAGQAEIKDTATLKIVIFEPQQARFIDVARNWGGHYKRFLENAAQQK
jgi:hypothetical protein